MSEKNVSHLPLQASVPAAFANYIEQGRVLAANAGLVWEITLDAHGVAEKNCVWDLRRLVNDGKPTPEKLRTFSMVPKALATMIAQGLLPATANTEPRAISIHWQDFIKAYAVNHLLVAGLSMQHLRSTCAMLRLLATATANKEPWRLDADDIRRCIAVARGIQPSGQNAVLIASFVKTVIDAFHLAETCPLSPMLASPVTGQAHYRAARYTQKEQGLRKGLLERKAEEKLPELNAFWELMRIVFTEKPRTFTDAIRFAQAKAIAITGLRIGEISFLPMDWKRTIDYRDRDGTPAGKRGGFSRALLLRHFAEKQGIDRHEVGSLYEETQFVPRMFEDILVQTLDDVARWTAPMRKMLKAQCETGRLLPMYAPDAQIPAELAYLHMTGSVLFRDIADAVSDRYIQRYRETLDLAALDELVNLQRSGAAFANQAWYQYAFRMRGKGIVFRHADGTPWHGRGSTNQFLRVDEIEAYVRTHTPTRVSDMQPFTLDGGAQLQAWEFLFLMPKRALGEGRDALPCHTGWHLGVGISTPDILGLSVAQRILPNAGPVLFAEYGLTESDRSLSLLPHSLRHLQNTELFRLGVADTIITKRFNRRSVAQSYEYDHRSLQEELEQTSLPDEWEAYLGPKASTVAKLVEAGRANGPIVREFKRLQAGDGDEAAYSFLKAEADGFHATPYGHCLNSFTVDPCPTNLECFNGCRHLSATNLPENRHHLVQLQGKLRDALAAAWDKSTKSIGRENQIRHAEVRLAGVTQLLNTAAGECVFPDGQDLSVSNKPASVLHATRFR
jgi:hypothetical protein